MQRFGSKKNLDFYLCLRNGKICLFGLEHSNGCTLSTERTCSGLKQIPLPMLGLLHSSLLPGPSPVEEPAHFCHHLPSAGCLFGFSHKPAILLSEFLVQKGIGVGLVLSHEWPHSIVVTWVAPTCFPQGDQQRLVCPSIVFAPYSWWIYLHVSFCDVSPGFTLRPVQIYRA